MKGDNDEEVVMNTSCMNSNFQLQNEADCDLGFSDGSTATGPEVSHAFQEPGEYIVKVTESLMVKSPCEPSLSLFISNLKLEVDNMECVCAPTAKDTIIPLSEHDGTSTLEGFVRVEHDGSSESCSLRNPLQECHVRVIMQRFKR